MLTPSFVMLILLTLWLMESPCTGAAIIASDTLSNIPSGFSASQQLCCTRRSVVSLILDESYELYAWSTNQVKFKAQFVLLY